MRVWSQLYFISGLSAIMGGFVILCDSEDTNHLEKEENGREREVGKDGKNNEELQREKEERWEKGCKTRRDVGR